MNKRSVEEKLNSIWLGYVRLLARYPIVILLGISVFSISALVCSLMLHDWPDFSDPQAGFETRGTLISSRLTAWENLLDSVSHIGPLTNNPSEAKRLQVIRPDPNTPRVQMLGTKIDHIIAAGSHKKNNRKRKGQSKNKTTKKKNRKQTTTTAAKTGKRKNVNRSTKQFKYKDGLKLANRNQNRRKNKRNRNVDIPKLRIVPVNNHNNQDEKTSQGIGYTKNQNESTRELKTMTKVVREKRQLDYYSLVEDYDDMEEFDEEQLYVANEGDDAFVKDDVNVYGYDELEEPAVEPLRLNEALLDIGWMCGDPMPDYAHVVFAGVRPDQNLFTYEAILSMCAVEATHLRSPPIFKELCESKGPADCCPGWSLGGYIAVLHKRSSCFSLERGDIVATRHLLKRCASYYHSGELTPKCIMADPNDQASNRACIRVPLECRKYNAVYNILHYLVDDEFLPPSRNGTGTLKYAMSFLPLARGSATLEYFYTITGEKNSKNYFKKSKRNSAGNFMIGDDYTAVVAMDLGIKDALFNEYMMEDAVYLLLAGGLIALAILAYTRSIFLTLTTLTSILYTLSLAYFFYTFVCGIAFFPFMNVLATVIAIGVGADDTFILVKSWTSQCVKTRGKLKSQRSSSFTNAVSVLNKDEQSDVEQSLEDTTNQKETIFRQKLGEDDVLRMVKATLKHSTLTISVTSITTSVAFFASFISNVTAIKCFSIFAGLAIMCNFLLMISWTPAALVFYQRFCCVNPLQSQREGPLPNTEESMPNAAVVAIASTGRLNCPSHLSSCNNQPSSCCDKTNCKCDDSNIIISPSESNPLCCFQQVLPNCDISSCCCCLRHSCCYSWLTGRRKRYQQNIVRHPAISSTPEIDAIEGSNSLTGNQNVFNVGGQVLNGEHSYFEQWSEGGAANKVVILNTPPPAPNSTRIRRQTSTNQKNVSFFRHIARFQFKPALHYLYSSFKHLYFSLFETILPCVIIKTRLLWIILLGGAAAGAAIIVFYLPGLRLPDKEEFQLFKSNHVFERYDLNFKGYFGFEKADQKEVSFQMPLRFVWGVRAIDGGRHLEPGNKGILQLDPNFNIATMESQRWMLRFCKDVQMQPFYHTLRIGQLSLSNCFMETFKGWMDRRCFDELAMKDHGKCCQVTKFPYPEPIFNQCLIEAIEDLYETPTDFWRPGAAGPKFNISTNKVEAMVVEFDSNVTFSFSHSQMDSFYRDVEMWFSKTISTAPEELRCGFFISHLGFYDVQNSLTWDTIAAIAIALSATFTVLVLATRNISLTISAAITVCATIFVTVGILILIFDWKLNILESVAITLSIGLSVDFSLHYAIAYTNASSSQKESKNVEESVIYAVVNMAAPVSMAALTTFLAGICLLPTRVLAYIQIGTFIAILMSTSWIFSTFFFHALLRIIGRGNKCETVDQTKETLVFQNGDDNIINSSDNTNLNQNNSVPKGNEDFQCEQNDGPSLSKEIDTSKRKEQIYAVSQSTVTHAVSVANGSRRCNQQDLSNQLRNELQQKVDNMNYQKPNIDHSNTIMITQEMLTNGTTKLHENSINTQVTTSMNPLQKSSKRSQDYDVHKIQKMSSLECDQRECHQREESLDHTDSSLRKNAGNTPRRNVSIFDDTNSKASPSIIMDRGSIMMWSGTSPQGGRQHRLNKIVNPLSSTSSDALDSPLTSRNLETSCSIGVAQSSFELLYESAIVHVIDESPTIKTDSGSFMQPSGHATPINAIILQHDNLRDHNMDTSRANKRQRSLSTSPDKRFIQKAPPPPDNVFNTHKTADTLRRQQRQQQRRERKKELKEQYKQQLQNHEDINPNFTMQNNVPYICSIDSNINAGKIHTTTKQSSYVPYEMVASLSVPQNSCPQCPPEYVVVSSINEYAQKQNNYVQNAKQEINPTTQQLQDCNKTNENKEPNNSFCDEKKPKVRNRSKSVHCHEYISPLYHEEIVTVVDDCHNNLIIKQDQKPRSNMNQRRSRSSSGVNNVVVKNWPDHRQNSYETVISALEDENMIINKVDYYPQDERYPTASMPLHSRLSTSNEAFVHLNSRADGLDSIKSCIECSDQYYLTRSLHRRSRHGSKKRNQGGNTNNQAKPEVSTLKDLEKRHPLSHSQETVLYTDDGFDPVPILPNRSPATPDVWLPIQRNIIKA